MTQLLRYNPARPAHYFACRGIQVAAGWLLGKRVDGHFEEDGFATEMDPVEVVAAVRATSIGVAPGQKEFDKTAALVMLGHQIDWWRSAQFHSLKLWAGNQGSLQLAWRMQKHLPSREVDVGHLLDFGIPMPGRFGLDPASSWRTIDIGFSPKRIGLEIQTYPVVELFACIGMQEFPPVRIANLWMYDIRGVRYRFEIAYRGQYYRYASWAEPEADQPFR